MNTLTWADIDFNLIQPGMITGGGQNGEQQTIVSFAEYLTVFLETVKHRELFFTGSINLRLKRMKFNTGAIRRAAMLDIDNFTDSYRWLVFYVFTPLRYQAFYSIEVLDDPVNAEDYELPNVLDEDPETGFAAFMGLTPEEYELVKRIANNQIYVHYEIFTARILRIIFDVFTKYTISTKSYQSNWTRQGSAWVAGPIEDNTLTRDVSETWTGFRGEGNTEDTLSSLNRSAYNEYLNDSSLGFRKDKWINSYQPNFNADEQMAFRLVLKSDTVGYSFVSYRSVEGHSLVWSFKNKDDQFVDVKFSMYGTLRSNYNFVDNYGRVSGRVDGKGKYLNNFPLLENPLFLSGGIYDAPPINISIDSMKSDTEFSNKGVITTYSLSAKYPVLPMPKSNKYEQGDDASDYRQEFWITSPMFVYADVNSEGFDYYVDPELWPADP